MPSVTRVQLVLLELAAACMLAVIAGTGGWQIVGGVGAAGLLALAILPLQRRWLYRVALSWLSMIRRRRAVRGPGLASLLGGYQVVAIAGGNLGTSLGVVRAGSTWTVVLELMYDDAPEATRPIPLEQLTALLRVEDVPMASVRLLTVGVRVAPGAYAGGQLANAPARMISRYCLLTFDSALAVDAVASRGGTGVAISQILRRCALRAEQTLASTGVRVQRLDEPTVSSIFADSIGAGPAQPGVPLAPTVESWRDIRVSGTWSTTFAVTGDGRHVADRVAWLAGIATTPVAVTTLMLRRVAPRNHLEVTSLLRLGGSGRVPDHAAGDWLADQARAAGLHLQRLDGDQGELLRATTPVGMPATVRIG